MVGCDCEVCTSADPRDNRLRSSVIIESANTRVVIDTTPDFRYQMLRTSTRHIDGIVFTHPHRDHIAGLDDVRGFNFFSRKPMEIYANAITEAALRRDFFYAFAENKYPGVPEININPIETDPFRVGDIPFLPVEVRHLHMPVLGFRIGNFTYITDANAVNDAEKEKIRGSEVMVLNALRKEPHISHFTLGEAVALVQELEVPVAYFTHISHQLGRHADVEAELPAGMHLAYDDLLLTV
jgi:phosphoribosyl 1,2-cyclic phosphate phosphodiesterase